MRKTRRDVMVLLLLPVLILCAVTAAHAQTRFYAEDFGAVGDGVIDDSKAIQACIDHVAGLPADESGHKGTVLLDKTYYVTRQVPVADDTSAEHHQAAGPHWRVFHVPSGVTIDGNGTVTLLHDGQSSRSNPANYTYVFWVAAYDNPERDATNPGRNEQVRDVTLRNITLLNDPASLYAPYSETSAIVVTSGRNVHIDGVKFRHWHRAIKMMYPESTCSVTNCTIEDTRYIGIAVYSARPLSDDSRLRITGNRLVGNTQLSGGIYIGGGNVDVADNHLQFTHGIFCESVVNCVIERNAISRSPYGLRVGYLAGGAARHVRVSDNTLTGCAAGIMLGTAANVTVERNTIAQFIAPRSDMMIEPPNGYWGFGREPVGINVEDGANVKIMHNKIRDLNEGVPVGVRVVNSRFTADYDNDGYGVTDANDLPGIDWNAGVEVVGNHVSASSGLAIAYYMENQSNAVLKDNTASGDSGGRVIASDATVENNQLDGELQVVENATETCRRLILKGHPAHWDGVPAGSLRFALPAPAFNEYFPPAPAAQ